MPSPMTDERKAQLIFNLVRGGERRAIESEIAAAAKLAAEEEGERRWRAEDDRAFDRSPYHPQTARDRLVTAQEERADWASLVEFAFERFMKEK